MNKLIYIYITSILINGIFANNTLPNLPKGSILPTFREHAISSTTNNPFVSIEAFPEGKTDKLADSYIEKSISKRIQGYLKSEEPSNSMLLLENGETLVSGNIIAIPLDGEEEGRPIKLTFEGIQSPHALFKIEDRSVAVNIESSKSKYQINTELQLTKGLILHEDGWVLAPIGNLKTGDSLSTYIYGTKYPVHLVNLHEKEGIALLKIFKSSPERRFPYIELSRAPAGDGDVLLAQQNLIECPPFQKQVAINGSYKPHINQESGAIKLNLNHEVVSIYTHLEISSSELSLILGEVNPGIRKPSNKISEAVVSIIKES